MKLIFHPAYHHLCPCRLERSFHFSFMLLQRIIHTELCKFAVSLTRTDFNELSR